MVDVVLHLIMVLSYTGGKYGGRSVTGEGGFDVSYGTKNCNIKSTLTKN